MSSLYFESTISSLYKASEASSTPAEPTTYVAALREGEYGTEYVGRCVIKAELADGVRGMVDIVFDLRETRYCAARTVLHEGMDEELGGRSIVALRIHSLACGEGYE